MKSFRSSAILLLLALALGSWIYFRERGAPVGDEVIWSCEPDAVRIIQLKTRQGNFTLQRETNNWTVTRDKQAPANADGEKVHQLLQQLQTIESDVSSPVDAGKLAEYGLDRPDMTVSINGKTLEFGHRPPFDATQIYLRVDSKIALVPANLTQLINQPFTVWRDKTVLRFAPEKVRQFQIRSPLLQCQFTRMTVGSRVFWQMSEPHQYQADTSTIANFLNQLAALKTPRFLQENRNDAARWGFDKPLARVTFQNPPGIMLTIGKRVPGGYAATSSTLPGIFTIDNAVFTLINRAPKMWRSRHFADFKLDEIDQVKITYRDLSQSFVRSSGKWRMQNSSTTGLDGDTIHQAVTDVILGVQQFTATDFLDSKASYTSNQLDRYGLTHPLLRLDLELNDGQGKHPLVLQIGNRSNRYFVRRSGDSSTIYQIAPSDFDRLSTGINVLFPVPAKASKAKKTSDH